MQKIHIYITFPILSFFSFAIIPTTYASVSENESRGHEGMHGTHSKHPPHDHQEFDHLKYIRTRDEKKKKPL